MMKVLDHGLGADGLPKFLSPDQLKAFYDGEDAHLGDPDYVPDATLLQPNVPALKPLTKGAAASGPEAGAAPVVSPPAPVKGDAVDVLADKLSVKLSGWWTKIKQGLGAKPPPATSPELSARIDKIVSGRRHDPSDALETPAGILVHAPRALRFDALGYRVHFAPPDGAPSEPVRDEPVRVRVERGEGDAGTEHIRARFDALDRLIENNFSALELMAQASSKMNVKTARIVLSKLEAMAAEYGNIVGPQNAVDYVTRVAALGIRFDQLVKGLSDGDVLPPEAAVLVTAIDQESMNWYINRIHQDAENEAFNVDENSGATMAVKLGSGRDERSVALIDISQHPLVSGGRIVSPAFRALVAAMTRSKDTPKGLLLLRDNRFSGHFKLGAHSAEVSANFLPPDEGGRISVRYQEWGTGYDNQTRLYYVARLLQKTGFHVEQSHGYLTAIIDKDHASQTVDQMTDTFALVIQALHATVGVDFALPLLVQGAKTSEEVGARIDQWVDVVLGEGTLPFYIHDEHTAMVAGWSEYQAANPARAQLRAALNRRLEALGLESIPSEEVLGQRSIDRFVNEPIEAAIARGELRLTTTGSVERTPHYDALAGLALGVAEHPASAAQLAEAVSSLDPGLLRFETIGSLGSLTVERAERRLEPGDWLTIFVLRDPKTGQIGFARAMLADLKPGKAPRGLDSAELFNRLLEQGFPVAPFAPSENPAGLEHFLGLLKTEPGYDFSLGRRAQGLAASPGHGRPVLARVVYEKSKAAEGGYVFVAPYTTPDDLDAIRASKAVITTSGGLLSHAAITTREMGIPAVILNRADWRNGVAFIDSPRFGNPYKVGGYVARHREMGEGGAVLAEGSLVRLEPGAGVVEAFPSNVAAPLLDAADALEKYDSSRDGRKLVAWIQSRLSSSALLYLQKTALVTAALDGLGARALERPEAAADLAAFYAALPKGKEGLGNWVHGTATQFFLDARREALAFLREKREAARDAMSAESLERALRAGEARATRLNAIAVALDRSDDALGQVAAELAGLRADAKRRGAKLLQDDVAELTEHARLFPNATVEVLPRLKAAIAKAKRRRVGPQVVSMWEARVAALERAREASLRAEAPLVMPLRRVLDMDVPRVGGKGAKLGATAEVVARAGGEVPPGLALTVDAYRQFLRDAGIADKLERVAADPDLSPEERSARARKLIMDAPLRADRGVGKAILEALKAENLEGVMLAVRSSAVDEDGAEAAFAGAGDTHLYVKPEELLPHVKEIWASLWNPRAMLYRETKGLTTKNLAQAVVVQAMVDSEVSGVAFTQDPVTGDSSRMIVNAAFGLGEGVVSGRVAPDQYVVGKALGREVLPAMVSDKKLAIVRGKDGVGTEEHRMPPEWRRRRSLTPSKLEKLNKVALALESHFGYALDIEFGFVGDKLYILQARPVTNNATGEEVAPPAVAKAAAVKAAAQAVAEIARSPASAPAAQEAKRVMFVCTGNTCRSPMAERLAKQKLREEGRDDYEVLSRGLNVSSIGAGMAPNAQAAMRDHGANPDGHVALPIAPSDVIWADVILTMTSAQAGELLSRYPSAKGKVFTLGGYSGVGGDIGDPYGGSPATYRASAAEISAAVDAALDRAEHQPAASAVAH